MKRKQKYFISLSFILILALNINIAFFSDNKALPACPDYYYKINVWGSTSCPDGYAASCHLPGCECNTVMNPRCFDF